MKKLLPLAVFTAGILIFSHSALAQAPTGATGQCKDGTYSTSASKSGACRGHNGVKEWYAAAPAKPAAKAAAAAPATTPMPPAKPAAAAIAPAPKPAMTAAPAPPAQNATPAKPKRESTASMAQAPGGGPGLVWVNTSTKVYHCSGTEFYGKTKAGSYMSEADAKAKGARPDHNKPCS